MKSLLIYNLFPRLYRDTGHWIEELDSISSMGFNAIYINPFHYPGFSGSLYAPKDYYEYNPMFFNEDSKPDEQLKKFIKAAHSKGIDVYMDFVANHTSIDCPLIADHKNWYVLTESGDVKRPGAWENGQYITWGDLATFNLESSPDKQNLWDYLLDVCRHYLKMGFKGFRCDAAYQIPSEFWHYLIPALKKDFSDIVFLAETLGCTPVQIQSISNCGFDYIFNSSKWWNYNDSWCLEQYSLTRTIAPSISFPETHDTARLMEEVKGDETTFLQRVYFEAVFSKGFMITSGMEYGFKKKLNVVETRPSDWEKTGKDYRTNIAHILQAKKQLKPLQEESVIEIIDQQNWMNVFCFVKEFDSVRVLVVLNKNILSPERINLANLESILRTDKIIDVSPDTKLKGYLKQIDILLKPGEMKIFAGEKHILK